MFWNFKIFRVIGDWWFLFIIFSIFQIKIEKNRSPEIKTLTNIMKYKISFEKPFKNVIEKLYIFGDLSSILLASLMIRFPSRNLSLALARFRLDNLQSGHPWIWASFAAVRSKWFWKYCSHSFPCRWAESILIFWW